MSIKGLFDLEIINMISSTVGRNIWEFKARPVRAFLANQVLCISMFIMLCLVAALRQRP